MIIKDIQDEDIVNYKNNSMVVAFPNCSFKCEKDCGIKCCQNSKLVQMPNIEYSIKKIVERYLKNKFTSSIVCAGLEPFDSWEDLLEWVTAFREKTNDDFVIYTGYKEEEIEDKVNILKQFPNIIIKFGRFVPNQSSHKDEILGVTLASPNQYAKKIS